MKKQIFTILFLTVFLSVGFFTFAETSAPLQLQGTVDSFAEISLATESVAGTLDLTIDTSDLLVGTVTERTNNPAGYYVTIASANGAYLVNSKGNKSHAYTLKYGGAAVLGLTTEGQEVTVSTSDTITPAEGINQSVNISYNAGNGLGADVYEDTLTFTIYGN